MPARRQTDEPVGIRKTKAPTILIADDDEQICRFLKDLLVPLGYTLRFAATGVQALAAIEKSPPDVMILDINMPGMNGVETYRHLAAAWPKGLAFGVIFLTGSMENPLFDEALGLGVPDVLLKPVNPMQVELAIKLQLHLLRRRQDKSQPPSCEMPAG
jgi:CheY-like chemotaxis protein